MHRMKGLVVGGMVLASAAAVVQPAAAQADRFRMLTEISHDLGVTPQQLAACFRSARATLTAAQSGAERKQARDAVLLPCLQKANPAITADSLNAAIDRYRQHPPATGG